MGEQWVVFALLTVYIVCGEKQQSPKPHRPSDPVIYPQDACPDLDPSTEWDYIVIGSEKRPKEVVLYVAGPAGAPVARRLAENKKVKVLILEAGGDPDPATDIPGNFFYKKEFTWNITTVPKSNQFQGVADNVGSFRYNYGRFVGGSSVINQMMYVRGNHRDYDEWKEQNCPGWGWDDILPYFLKMENFVDERNQAHPNWRYHNKGGPFTTSPPQEDPQTAPFRKVLAKALKNAKIPYNKDINGRKQTGFGDLTLSVESSGYRGNVAKAYLLNIPDNLKICKFAVVQKLLLTDKSVSGVEYVYNDTKRVAKAKEYILAGGPWSSPQILERSGIGQQKVLEKAGVDVIHELAGVGENLYEHVGNLGCQFSMDINTQSARNPLTISLTSLAIFLNLTDFSHPVPDLQWIFVPFAPVLLGGLNDDIVQQYEDIWAKRFILGAMPVVLRQTNPGSVHIAGTNPLNSPIFDVNQYTSPAETRLAGDGCRLIRKIMSDPVLKDFGAKPIVLKACEKHEFNSDDEIMCELSYMTFPFYHLAGTTKMGPASDKMAVVDTNMRVHGIRRLRIVDLGIMPHAPRSNTEIPTIAVSEKAADIIKRDDRIA